MKSSSSSIVGTLNWFLLKHFTGKARTNNYCANPKSKKRREMSE